MECEAPNPLTPSLEKALVEFPAPLKRMRELAFQWVNEGRLKLDCFNEFNPVEVLEIIKAEHPDLDAALDAMASLPDKESVQMMPGPQPHMDSYVGVFNNDKTNKPIINVGSGSNKEKGCVNYDPFHYFPDSGKYGACDNSGEYRPITHHEYVPSCGPGLRLDDSIPKCSRGVLQRIPPESLPDGDQVHIVPDFEIWSENKAAESLGDGRFKVIDFQSAGGPVGGIEYDHKVRYGFAFKIGWHMVLYRFVSRIINHVSIGDSAIPHGLSHNQLVRPGRDSDLPVVKAWMEKLDGVLCHLYCDGKGKSYLYQRNQVTGKVFTTGSAACHLILEKVNSVYYLLGGVWNMIKLHQDPDLLNYFLENVTICIDGSTVVGRKSVQQFEEGMEGLIGCIGGQWQSVYYKSKNKVTLDLDWRTYGKLQNEALLSGILINNKQSEAFENSNRVYQVKYVEEEVEIERSDGSNKKVPLRKFSTVIEYPRFDKTSSDSIQKAICLLQQRRAEDILEEFLEK